MTVQRAPLVILIGSGLVLMTCALRGETGRQDMTAKVITGVSGPVTTTSTTVTTPADLTPYALQTALTALTARVTKLEAAVFPPASPPPPAPPPISVDGTMIPPATKIVDSAHNVWTLSSSTIMLNGSSTATLGWQTTQMVYHNSLVYILGMDTNWYDWSNNTWTQTTSPLPTPTPPPSSTTGLPTPMLFGWVANGGVPSVGSVLTNAPQYNVLAWFGIGADNSGSIVVDLSNESSAQLVTDIAAWKASTDKHGNHRMIILQISDAGTPGSGNAEFTTATNATNCVNSLIALVSQYGFQGINWDLEGAEGSTWNATTINSINSQLKAKYGSSFIVSGTPRPFEIHAGSTKRGWMATDDFTVPQYYFDDSYTPDWTCSQMLAREAGTDQFTEGLAQFVNGSDGGVKVPASKIVLGNYVGSVGGTSCSNAAYASAYRTLAAQYPGLGGIGVWALNADATNGWQTAKAYGAALGL